MTALGPLRGLSRAREERGKVGRWTNGNILKRNRTVTIEGLWAVDFGNQMGLGSGVAIFETNRVFGGDSGWYYVGRYEVDREIIRGRVHIKHYGAEMEAVTGHLPGQTFDIDVAGVLQGEDRINAHGEVVGDSSRQVEIRMRRLADLP